MALGFAVAPAGCRAGVAGGTGSPLVALAGGFAARGARARTGVAGTPSAGGATALRRRIGDGLAGALLRSSAIGSGVAGGFAVVRRRGAGDSGVSLMPRV